jgi:hypothetical protein
MYSYREETSELYRTQLLTGEAQLVEVRFWFRRLCCLMELTGGDLLITGGGFPSTELVERISKPDMEVDRMTSMHVARRAHVSLELDQYVYVLGGNPGPARSFERFNGFESRWEKLPDSPRDCDFANAVARGNRIYVFRREYYQEFHVESKRGKLRGSRN